MEDEDKLIATEIKLGSFLRTKEIHTTTKAVVRVFSIDMDGYVETLPMLLNNENGLLCQLDQFEAIPKGYVPYSVYIDDDIEPKYKIFKSKVEAVDYAKSKLKKYNSLSKVRCVVSKEDFIEVFQHPSVMKGRL